MALVKRFFSEIGRALRETSSAVDRAGLGLLDNAIYKEPFSRHRSVMNLYDKHPVISADAFIAPNATVVGRVDVNKASSVWYGAVVRGDLNSVSIGAFTSIGDRAVVTTTKSVEGHVAASTSIGNHVLVGPGALLQSCTIEEGAVIGAGAIIMEGAVVEAGAVVEDGAVVHPGRRIPGGQVWGGNPAAFRRDVTKGEAAHTEDHAVEVSALAAQHAAEFLPYSTAYQAAEGLPAGAMDTAVRKIAEAQAAAERKGA